MPARERLARLLAENLNRAGEGLRQLDLLLAMPGQPENKLAEWLALAASWQLVRQRDEEAALETFGRLIRDFPQSPQAFAAQRQSSLLLMARRIRQSKALNPSGADVSPTTALPEPGADQPV
jgi:hypothetical protein